LVDDARNRTKDWLDTYITASNVTKDDAIETANGITHYAKPPYPLRRIFFDEKNIDWIISIGQPRTTPSHVDWDGTIISYNEKVPIEINTVTKSDVTGDLLLEKAEAEFRRVLETYPLGSYRSFTQSNPSTTDMGGWNLYGVSYILTYKRDVT